MQGTYAVRHCSDGHAYKVGAAACFAPEPPQGVDTTHLQDGVLVLQAGDLVLLGLHLLRQAIERLLQLLEAQLAPLPAIQNSYSRHRRQEHNDQWTA